MIDYYTFWLPSISPYVTTRSSAGLFMHVQCFKYLPVSQSLSQSQTVLLGFHTQSFSHVTCYWFFTLTLGLIIVSCLSSVAFPTIKFKSTSTGDIFTDVFDSFMYLIILVTFRITPVILIGTYNLPNELSVVLQVPSHLFIQTMNSSNEVHQDSN